MSARAISRRADELDPDEARGMKLALERDRAADVREQGDERGFDEAARVGTWPEGWVE